MQLYEDAITSPRKGPDAVRKGRVTSSQKIKPPARNKQTKIVEWQNCWPVCYLSSRFVFNRACFIPIFILSCDDCGGDGHFLLAAPGPPEESHKARARVQLYRGLSDRKKRRVPACASVREGPSARINVINRQRICWAICTSSNEIHQTRILSPPTIKSTGILPSSDWSGKLQRGG